MVEPIGKFYSGEPREEILDLLQSSQFGLAVLMTLLDTAKTKLDDSTIGLGALKALLDAVLLDTGTTLEGKLDTINGIVAAILVDTSTTLEAKLDALDVLIDAIEAKLDDEATGLAALKDLIDAIEAKLDLAVISATFTYLNAGGEQTVFTFTPTANSKVHIIWLDLFTLTQNTTIRLKHQIDGANYRTFETFNWTTGMDDGVYFRDIVVANRRPIQVTIQEVADEGADRATPYYYAYEVR